MSNPEDKAKNPGMRFSFIVLFAAIILVWWVAPDLARKMAGTGIADASTLGEFGDTYGSINALFSGLAFFGLIVTIYLQGKELKATREELELTRVEVKGTNDALKGQTEQMKMAGLLAALPVLIDHEKGRLHTLAPHRFKPRDLASYGAGELESHLNYLADLDKEYIQACSDNFTMARGLHKEKTHKELQEVLELDSNREVIKAILQNLIKLTEQLEGLHTKLSAESKVPPATSPAQEAA